LYDLGTLTEREGAQYGKPPHKDSLFSKKEKNTFFSALKAADLN
jgi:hypothetical protein